MSDNEIIKALDDALHIGDSPIGKHWGCFLTKQQVKDAFDLINRQKAEIEKLKKHIKEGVDLAMKIPEMVKLAHDATANEFARRLKEKGFYDEDLCEAVVYVADIDNLAKEMTEEEI